MIDNKKGFAFPASIIVAVILILIFIIPLFKASGTATNLLGNPIIVLLIIIGFFLWATKGK